MNHAELCSSFVPEAIAGKYYPVNIYDKADYKNGKQYLFKPLAAYGFRSCICIKTSECQAANAIEDQHGLTWPVHNIGGDITAYDPCSDRRYEKIA